MGFFTLHNCIINSDLVEQIYYVQENCRDKDSHWDFIIRFKNGRESASYMEDAESCKILLDSICDQINGHRNSKQANRAIDISGHIEYPFSTQVEIFPENGSYSDSHDRMLAKKYPEIVESSNA